MSLNGITAPAVSYGDVQKLRAFCTEKRLTRESTSYDIGYEQCKRDFLAKLETLVGKPEPTGHRPMDVRR